VRRVLRLPGWLVFLVFFPLQVYLTIKLWQSDWAWWLILLTLLVLGFLGNRAARVPWMQQLFFPRMAAQREARRHVYQGILFLGAAVAFLFKVGPLLHWTAEGISLLAVMTLVTLLKASVR
jgi:hypothetical protein